MDSLAAVLISQGLLAVATIAATRANQRSQDRRLTAVERVVSELPKTYVPRSEVDLALRSIEKSTGVTNEFLRALLLRARNRDRKGVELEASAEVDLITAYLAIAPRWEKRERGMYLDSVGLVTCAIGCMLPDALAAAKLPWRHPGSGALATAEEILREFARVKAMQPDHLAHYYSTPTSLVLADPDIDALFRARCSVFVQELPQIFPLFDHFKPTRQLALLDMIFNLGRPRFLKYTHLIAAVNAGAWAEAARQCERNEEEPAFAPRNEWTIAQLSAAAEIFGRNAWTRDMLLGLEPAL